MKGKSPLRLFLYILLVVLILLTFYAIFNAGNPSSLFRLVVADPAYDITITVALAVGLFVVVLLLKASGGQNRLHQLLELNSEHIHNLRQKGRSDNYIAESFLSQVGVKSGFLYRVAKRRVLRYLSRL